MTEPNAVDVLTRVLDSGSWVRWDEPILAPEGVDADYQAALRRSAARTGLDEAIVTGEGRIRGRRVAIVATEYGFLGGSVSVAGAERLVRAIERATAKRMPLLATTASSGVRMQEGSRAFVQMIKITAAAARHRAAGLVQVMYLRRHATGGVLQGSLGHVTLAEPGAMISTFGPRLYEVVTGKPATDGVPTAEDLVEHGIVDATVAPADLPFVLVRILDVLMSATEPLPAMPPPPESDAPGGAEPSAWESVSRTRRSDRPGVLDLLTEFATDVTTLSGTAAGELGHGMVLALARFGSAPCVLLGQHRRPAPRRLGPAGLRVARRGLRLAADLRLPLLAVVDTVGAVLTPEAEQAGLSGEIARCMAEMITLRAPTLCLLLGSGAGGAALAFAPADRVIAAQHAWLAPLQPEGSSVILHRTVDRAAEVTERTGVAATALLRSGIVDRVVPEKPDAADERVAFLERLSRVLAEELIGLLRRDPAERLAARLNRYRSLGT